MEFENEALEIIPNTLWADVQGIIDYAMEEDEYPVGWNYSSETIKWESCYHPVITDIKITSYSFSNENGEKITPEKGKQIILEYFPDNKKSIEVFIADVIWADDMMMKYYRNQLEEELPNGYEDYYGGEDYNDE